MLSLDVLAANPALNSGTSPVRGAGGTQGMLSLMDLIVRFLSQQNTCFFFVVVYKTYFCLVGNEGMIHKNYQ